MRLNAYILAGDPTWVEASIRSYYGVVDRIIVSYDANCRGWTGAPIDVEKCLRLIREIDTEGKCDYRPGHFARPAYFLRPMVNDTHQRQVALGQAAAGGADWVLQLDTDEVLPKPDRLVAVLREADIHRISAVEWPMRVLFRKLRSGQFLEVCARGGRDRFEYPGPVAVKPTVELIDARRSKGPFIRPIVHGDNRSLQLLRPAQDGERRVESLDPADAVIHNSWAREPASVRAKIASWSHNDGWRSWAFYYLRWKPSPALWRIMRDFHPFHRPLWPALKRCSYVPDLTRLKERPK